MTRSVKSHENQKASLANVDFNRFQAWKKHSPFQTETSHRSIHQNMLTGIWMHWNNSKVEILFSHTLHHRWNVLVHRKKSATSPNIFYVKQINENKHTCITIQRCQRFLDVKLMPMHCGKWWKNVISMSIWKPI